LKNAWQNFIERHGHRGVREGELYETEWAKDPASIIEGIKSKVRLHKKNGDVKLTEKRSTAIEVTDEELTSFQKKIKGAF